MFAVIHLYTGQIWGDKLFSSKRDAKLSLRNNNPRNYHDSLGVAKVKTVVIPDTTEAINTDTNKWEKVTD